MVKFGNKQRPVKYEWKVTNLIYFLIVMHILYYNKGPTILSILIYEGGGYKPEQNSPLLGLRYQLYIKLFKIPEKKSNYCILNRYV